MVCKYQLPSAGTHWKMQGIICGYWEFIWTCKWKGAKSTHAGAKSSRFNWRLNRPQYLCQSQCGVKWSQLKKIWFLISCCSSPFRLYCFCQGNQETKEWSDLQSRSELRGGDRPQDWCRTSILQAPWFFTAQWCPKRRVLGTLTSQERHRQEIISSQERL